MRRRPGQRTDVCRPTAGAAPGLSWAREGPWPSGPHPASSSHRCLKRATFSSSLSGPDQPWPPPNGRCPDRPIAFHPRGPELRPLEVRPRPHWAWTRWAVGLGLGAHCCRARLGHGAPGGAVAGGDPRETGVSEPEVQRGLTAGPGALCEAALPTSWAAGYLMSRLGSAGPARTQIRWSRRWSPCWVSALWPAAGQLGSLPEAVAGEVGGWAAARPPTPTP